MASKKGTWPQAIGSLGLSLLLILSLRWLLIEPYVIPSKSMLPTLLVNDHIFVNKLAYGLRLPFSSTWLVQWSEPKRGDVIVFKYPIDPNIFYVKRVVGLPGETVNGDGPGEVYEVPEGHVFVMGDNRDNSSDSRVWGGLPVENILGRANFIWFSCDSFDVSAMLNCDPDKIRYGRIGNTIR